MSLDPHIPLSPASFSSQEIPVEKTGKATHLSPQDTGKISAAAGEVLAYKTETTPAHTTSSFSATHLHTESGKPVDQVRSVLTDILEPKQVINENLDAVKGKLEFINSVLKNIDYRQGLANQDASEGDRLREELVDSDSDLNLDHLKSDLDTCLSQLSDLDEILNDQATNSHLDLDFVNKSMEVLIDNYASAAAQLHDLQNRLLEENLPQPDEVPLTNEAFVVSAAIIHPEQQTPKPNPLLDMLSFRLPEPEFADLFVTPLSGTSETGPMRTAEKKEISVIEQDTIDTIETVKNLFEELKPLKKQLDEGSLHHVSGDQMKKLIEFREVLQEVETAVIEEYKRESADSVFSSEERTSLAPRIAEYEAVRSEYWMLVDGLFNAADAQDLALPQRSDFIEVYKNNPYSK